MGANPPTNPALYLSEERRLEGNNRQNKRDVGLNQERNIEARDIEGQEWKDLSIKSMRSASSSLCISISYHINDGFSL